MIIFHQHHVVQAEAVINAATRHDRCFFERTKPRCGFSGIQNLNARIVRGIDKFAGERGDAGEPLEKIQSYPLRF